MDIAIPHRGELVALIPALLLDVQSSGITLLLSFLHISLHTPGLRLFNVIQLYSALCIVQLPGDLGP